jgi:hypothetical protein
MIPAAVLPRPLAAVAAAAAAHELAAAELHAALPASINQHQAAMKQQQAHHWY